MNGEVACTCWCESETVYVPVEWVSEGRTLPCDLPACEPGCPSRGGDAFEDEWEEPPAPAEHVRPPKRPMLHDYDPSADSSPGAGGLYPGLALLVDSELCQCGCTTAQPSKADFLPGHDARLKGKLQRAMAADVAIHLLRDGLVLECTPAGLAAERGWSEIVAKGADRIRRRSRTPVAAEKRLARIVEDRRDSEYTLEHFGRWDQTGRAVAVWTLPGGTRETQYVTPDGELVTL